MKIDIYEACVNPISGETFQTLSITEEAFTVQWTVLPNGYVPFEHVHLNQDEVFYVESGEMRILMEGQEYFAKAGETITVPKGKRHIAYNNTEELLSCKVEYRPALDHEVFMKCFVGLMNDGLYDKKGAIDISKMGYFLAKMKAKCMARPTSIPASMFKVGLKFFYLKGTLAGWGKLYERYTKN